MMRGISARAIPAASAIAEDDTSSMMFSSRLVALLMSLVGDAPRGRSVVVVGAKTLLH